MTTLSEYLREILPHHVRQHRHKRSARWFDHREWRRQSLELFAENMAEHNAALNVRLLDAEQSVKTAWATAHFWKQRAERNVHSADAKSPA